MVATWARLNVELIVGRLLPEASGVRPELQQVARAIVIAWSSERRRSFGCELYRPASSHIAVVIAEAC